MRGFIRFCIQRPVFTGCSVIIFVLLGINSYLGLGVTLYPNVELPFVLVRTTYTGAGPNEIEQLVTKPLEDALSDLEGLKSVTSFSSDGVSMLSVEMRSGVDPDLALVDVNNKVKAKIGQLPRDADDPVCMKFDINAQPFMIVSFTSDMSEKDARKIIEDRIKPIVARVNGVGQVEVAGGREREIQIELNPAALSDYGVSFQKICAVIAANNVTNPSGYITQKNDEISLRLLGEFNRAELLEDILIPNDKGQPVPLSLLGKVVDGEKDVRSMARANGESVIQMKISPRANADVVKAGGQIRKSLEDTLKLMPAFKARYTYDDTNYIEVSVKNVIRDTAVGIVLTALVIYMFLGRLSATFIVAVSMPVAFMATFIPMQMHGYTLNLMSTLGLGLSMGTLVMNAILILQNIYRYRDMGYEPFEAAEEGTVEISISVLAGVLTNLGVFMPVAMMSGIAGQFLKPYAVTIVYATVFSLWVTMSVTPCLAARIKGTSSDLPLSAKILTGWWNWIFEGFQDMFMFFLRFAMRHSILTIVISLLLMFGALKLGGLLGMQFIPVTDDGSITIDLTLDNNSSIERTEAMTRRIERFIDSMPEKQFMRDIVSTVGASMKDNSLFKSSVVIYLKEDPKRPATWSVADKIKEFTDTLEGAEINITATRKGFGNPIEVRIMGEDMSILYKIAEELRAKVRNIPGIVNLTIETEMGKPELQVLPIRWRLTPLGLNIAELSNTVKGYLIGADSGKFRQDGFEYDIKARLDREKAHDVYSVTGLPIMTQYGLVPLSEMANVEWSDAPTEIQRYERERTIVVSGNVRYITSGEGNDKIREVASKMELPPGYRISFGGESESMADEFAKLVNTMLIAVMITYIIVAAILESWVYSVVILLTVPMAAIGVIPAMLVSGIPISIFALIGMIMLVGMVVNNAIVVVDYAENLRTGGMHPYEAVETASEVRFKSLVMAVATSVVSLVPLAISTGRGAEMRAPIAVVAIGGLIAGGLLALLAIPAAYKIYWGVRMRFGKTPVVYDAAEGVE